MSFSTKMGDTPQSLLEEHLHLGGRLIMTIPFDSTINEMQGFVSVLGSSKEEEESLPILTICVKNPNSGSTVSTIVFKDDQHYLNFLERLQVDGYLHFMKDNISYN